MQPYTPEQIKYSIEALKKIQREDLNISSYIGASSVDRIINKLVEYFEYVQQSNETMDEQTLHDAYDRAMRGIR